MTKIAVQCTRHCAACACSWKFPPPFSLLPNQLWCNSITVAGSLSLQSSLAVDWSVLVFVPWFICILPLIISLSLSCGAPLLITVIQLLDMWILDCGCGVGSCSQPSASRCLLSPSAPYKPDMNQLHFPHCSLSVHFQKIPEAAASMEKAWASAFAVTVSVPTHCNPKYSTVGVSHIMPPSPSSPPTLEVKSHCYLIDTDNNWGGKLLPE